MQSLFNRFNVTEKQLDELDKACNDFYTCCALFLKVNPTVWTLGKVVPSHTRDVFIKYGKGLIINSMEGRRNTYLYQDMHKILRTSTAGILFSDMNSYRSSGSEREGVISTATVVLHLC